MLINYLSIKLKSPFKDKLQNLHHLHHIHEGVADDAFIMYDGKKLEVLSGVSSELTLQHFTLVGGLHPFSHFSLARKSFLPLTAPCGPIKRVPRLSMHSCEQRVRATYRRCGM